MGKKVKTGKSRRDKYYQLAKETGFRARSAFKLLQLNRKFKFLETSRVCIDLCAAPGGWLQVAQQHMPMSSHIIGVDLVPIKPIRNVITLTEDITTEKCRSAIRKEIHTWQVDVVLNDGAPNVGKNWIHDAFSQSQLTLQALKLAISFLRKGGWFVTKVFRSQDYNSLIWVFRQLFKKVFATKPKASRSESAEIFVVCQYYLKPDKIDAKFTDPRFVFKEVAKVEGTPIDLMHPAKRNKKCDGYAEGDYTQYHKLPVLEFLASNNHLERLASSSEIVIDDQRIISHPLTTDNVRECCKDIKVLGKREIRIVLNWRKKLKDLIKHRGNKSISLDSDDEDYDESVDKVPEKKDDGGEEENEEDDIYEQLATLRKEEEKEVKKKQKKARLEKSKLQKKLELKMVLPGDYMDVSVDSSLFKLKSIQSKQHLAAVEEIELDELDEEMSSSEDETTNENRKQREMYDRYEPNDYGYSSESGNEGEEDKVSDWGSDDETNKEMKEPEKIKNTNPRLVKLENEMVISQKNTNVWFNKDSFNMMNDDDDEDVEIGQSIKQYKNKGGKILEKERPVKKKKDKSASSIDENLESKPIKKDSKVLDDESDDSDSDSELEPDHDESEDDIQDVDPRKVKKVKGRGKAVSSKDGFEIVPASRPLKKQKLDAEALALGSALAQSQKRRREVIESAYNRYTFDDQSLRLPDWFTKDESRHYFTQLPVTKEEVETHKQREIGIDARPIKKVAEAKARKKRKLGKRLDKARRKAENISETVDVTDKEKSSQIKSIYKKAGLLRAQEKKEITYVVGRRGTGKRVSRPAGVKGKFKVVDPRMKKEVRKKMDMDKKKGKGKRKR